jgi:AraC family transcriptional activator of pobA
MSYQKLSIDQILSAFGETPLDENLHIYFQDNEIRQLPISVPFRLDHYCIILVTSGECELQFDLKAHAHQKNDLILLVPNAVNEFIRMSADYHFKLVSFSTQFPVKLGVNQQHIEAFSFFTSQQPLIVSLTEGECTIISTLIDLLNQKRSQKNHPFRNELILHSFTMLTLEISAIVKKQLSITRNQLSHNEELSLRFLKLLSENVTVERSVQFYANQLSVTPNYLNKLSKKFLHRTAGSIIDEMVIQESKILLHKSSLSIAQIAEKLFFNDQFQFSRFFKNLTGFSPTAYRKVET